MQSDQPETVKKPYQSPRLKIYGDISALTRSFGAMAAKRDHSGGSRKTH
jgi:hypothetical protein